MTRFGALGCIVECNAPLPELGPPGAHEPLVAIRILPAAIPGDPPGPWFVEARSLDGSVRLSRGRAGARILLRFHSLADVFLALDPPCIDACPSPGTPPDTLRHLLLDHALPLLLAGVGAHILHASCVETPGGALAFLGASTAGKSTLAAGFCACGDRLVADDCLLISGEASSPQCVPSYPGLRLSVEAARALFPEAPATTRVAHYSTKIRLGADALRWDSSPAPLRRIYVVEAGSEIRVSRLAPREGLMALTRATWRLDPGDHRRVEQEFRFLGDLATALPCRRVEVPRGFERLADVRRAVLADLAENRDG